jgi:Tfp pilus assembly protein PilW
MAAQCHREDLAMRLQGASDKGWLVALVVAVLLIVAAVAVYLYVIAPA